MYTFHIGQKSYLVRLIIFYFFWKKLKNILFREALIPSVCPIIA